MMSRTGAEAINLYLIGFMGVGKSAVGRGVARVLKMQFIDSDRAIEETIGTSIREYFEKEGESAFRDREREFIESGHPSHGCVVACGGGLPIASGMIELLRARGVVVSLFAGPETILERTKHSDKRPLLNVPDPAGRVEELLREREAIYMQAGPGICTDNRALQEVILHLARIYHREAMRFSNSAAGSAER